MAAADARAWRAAALAAAVSAALAAVPARSAWADATGPRSATMCAACHGPIQRAWQASSKAHSWTNPVFQAGLADARAARGERIVLRCLSCHAPLAAASADLSVANPVSQEGITCNFCHNVSQVEASPLPASYTFDSAKPNLMRGPYPDAEPGSAHEAAYVETFTKSEFCASCHWGDNDDQGVEFEATFPAWRASRAAAAGRQCQDCHMPPAPGKASALSKKQRPAVYAHTFVGPRTPGGLDSVATVAGGVVRGRLRVTVRNTRGGHALPGGGHSLRAISLEAVFYDAAGKELSHAAVATYGTEFADSAGHGPVPKWLGVTVRYSHEIPADSTVVEWADVPAHAKRAALTLTYLPIAPAYRARLEAAHVDLTGRDPVVLARAEVPLP
ncbi:MAG TPA: multiheme c-type cytochrome [Candidatus Limnocylindrales bacterium]|nr:multiheme c-type cytochrome [Candidatus Limnocylindrales bacterium]